jgi:DNA (cytosine-5)-methyltransferase 1
VKLTALSLFSGVGGLDLGLHRAGFVPILMCEADAYKRSVLAAHWPEVPIHDDVRTLDDAPPADLVHGGFPCQDVSVAGRRAGLAGERTGLYFDALRFVDAVRPRAVLLENVPLFGSSFFPILLSISAKEPPCILIP